ncbi:MAG TPA: helix-turn-helix transcriptional regulator [Stellaceae bacterium]|nr:helix-turn-helix transcriptional regulator [Stellaceae bacterium]
MAIRFDDIGNRLKAFRLASGLSADAIARRLDISRAALYRFERGELAKIETLEKLAELLDVSVPTLLGVGVEYLPSAVAYFERLRQIEETASHIVVLAGPISYLLASDAFHDHLKEVLLESIPGRMVDTKRSQDDVQRIMAILAERKATYRKRHPTIVNLVSAAEVGRFLTNGFSGRVDLSEKVRRERRRYAKAEVEHFIAMLEDPPVDVQIGVVPDALPQTGFQIFRQADRDILTISPFRLGEHPNIRVGVAMVTSAPEALNLHQKVVREIWGAASKGAVAAKHLSRLIDMYKI